MLLPTNQEWAVGALSRKMRIFSFPPKIANCIQIQFQKQKHFLTSFHIFKDSLNNMAKNDPF